MVRDTFIHGSGTLLVKVARIAQEILVASLLALHGSLDGWMAAYALASLPVNLLLHAYQPPLVARLSRNSSSPSVLRHALLQVLLPGICGAFFVLAIGPAWVAHALTAESARFSAISLLPLLAFFTIAGSANVALNGALQAQGRFFAAGVLPVAAPLVIGAMLLGLPNQGVRALALGLALGSAVEASLSLVILRFGAQRSGDAEVTETAGESLVIREALVLVPGVLCAALVPLVEQYYASRAGGEGGVAVLGYAQRLPYFLAGTLSLSISAVGTTTLARVSGDSRVAGVVLNRVGAWLLGLSTVLVLPLALASRPLTAAIFERGVFEPSATALVAPVTALLLAGLPFTLLRLLALRSLTVARRNGMASAVQATGLLMVVVFNGLLQGADLGVRGVAAVSSLAMALTASIAWFQAARSTRDDSTTGTNP